MGRPAAVTIHPRSESLTEVLLLTARWCSICPSAKQLWRELKLEHDFEYLEIDVETDKGQQLVERHSIASVPTTIVNGRTVIHGVPLRNYAESLVSETRRLSKSLP